MSFLYFACISIQVSFPIWDSSSDFDYDSISSYDSSFSSFFCGVPVRENMGRTNEDKDWVRTMKENNNKRNNKILRTKHIKHKWQSTNKTQTEKETDTYWDPVVNICCDGEIRLRYKSRCSNSMRWEVMTLAIRYFRFLLFLSRS